MIGEMSNGMLIDFDTGRTFWSVEELFADPGFQARTEGLWAEADAAVRADER